MDNTIIIKIESGVIADVYSTHQIQLIVVDYDMIEGDESFEHRIRKAVISMTPDYYVRPEDIDEMIRSLVVKCIRPDNSRPATFFA